jgi:chromosome partitioning protein
MIGKTPHILVFANEKGGTGKSTCAVHVAVALSCLGFRVGGIDLDSRQRTFFRYLENRAAFAARRNIDLPTPRFAVFNGDSQAALDHIINDFSRDCDFLVADTPGRDDKYARLMAARATTLVTPINDSFVDLDLIGQVDPDTFIIKRPSFYAELIWETRRDRAKVSGHSIDWVVMRNRLQTYEARNMRRVGQALEDLSRRVGFRTLPGLRERVIYRELFPAGLTLLDKGQLGPLGISHIAARQELRELVSGLALPIGHALEAAPAMPDISKKNSPKSPLKVG